MMTRRHYEMVADVLRDAQSSAVTAGEITVLNGVTAALASAFAGDNPDFNMDRFLTKCGVGRL